jgi:hypothetical protein
MLSTMITSIGMTREDLVPIINNKRTAFICIVENDRSTIIQFVIVLWSYWERRCVLYLYVFLAIKDELHESAPVIRA